MGLDQHIERLTRDLRLIFDPQLVRKWSEENYGRSLPVVALLHEAVPLIILEGDVGTGKTVLAETIAQRVALVGKYGVHLVKMSTSVRGTAMSARWVRYLPNHSIALKPYGRKKENPFYF